MLKSNLYNLYDLYNLKIIVNRTFMNLSKLIQERQLEIDTAIKYQEKDTSRFLSNQISINESSISSSNIENIILNRNKDSNSIIYDNELALIFIKYGDLEYNLKLTSVIETYPPKYIMNNYDCMYIDTLYSCQYILDNPLELHFRYGDKWKSIICDNQLDLVLDNNSKYPEFQTLSEPKIIFKYDLQNKGLYCPRVEYQFSNSFWEEFKVYEQYLTY